MAWGQEKGADVKISALPVSMRFFDFVPCSLPLKTLILLTFLCFLIRRRGTAAFLSEFYRFSVRIPRRSQIAWRGHLTAHWPQDRQTDSSMWERLSVTVIAPAGQTF